MSNLELVSYKLIKFLESVEGIRLIPYNDIGGAPTIGIGHLITKSERSSGKIYIDGIAVRYECGITNEQAYSLLRDDICDTAQGVKDLLQVEVSQSQFDALVSFTFNVGVSAFKNSTLLKKINCGLFDAVPAQFRRWVYVHGKLSLGLSNRREAEIELWSGRW